MSVSSTRSVSPLVFMAAANGDSEEWVKEWGQVHAKDLIDSPVIAVDAEMSVEEACDLLLSKDLLCLAVKRRPSSPPHATPYHGLFDSSDVNAFLTLAATRHKLGPDELKGKPRLEEIVVAAKAGRVPVHLVSNLSEKNPLEALPHDATLLSLLAVFSRGAHRVLIQSDPPSTEYLGMVSDRRLLAWFTSYAQSSPSFLKFLANPLSTLTLPSLYLYTSVVAVRSTDNVLHAMTLMSDQGVSSVAVIEEETGRLLSAVSVTDIERLVVPAQSNHILSLPLHQFVALIKEPDGSTDGVDKYPVYSVTPSSTLYYTMQKLLATDAHRLFVTDETLIASPTAPSTGTGNLCGIVSTVDVLAQFARIANLPVDPTRMQRHRRASSVSSQSSSSSSHSRSASRSARFSPNDSLRNSVSSLDGFQWAERVPASK